VLALHGFRKIAAFSPDIIHIFKPKAVSGVVQALAWHFDKQAAVVLDCDDWEGKDGWSKFESYPWAIKMLFEVQERYLLTRNDAATVASNELENRLRYVAPERPLARVPNFFDPFRHTGWQDKRQRMIGREAIGLSVEGPVAIVYSRFFDYPVGGYYELIEAFLKMVPDAHVIIGGQGHYGQHDYLRQLLSSAGYQSRVTWLGWLKPESIGAVLAAADVALMPALNTVPARSKCPARLLDLLVAGVPIAAHDVGEARTYITDGANGKLVSPNSGLQLAMAAAELLTEEARVRARGYAQERISRDLSPGRIAHVLLELYGEALSRRKQR
jgi:glycosyltransferase involved in cell wall biosynthesis